MSSSRNPIAIVDGWLFGPGSAQRLAAMRIGLAGYLLLRIALRPALYLDLPDKPDTLFSPRGSLGVLLRTWPSKAVVVALFAVCVVAAAAATAGLFSRVTLPLATLTSLCLNTLVDSQGKIIHNDVLLTLCLLAIMPARTGDAWSLDALRARRRARAAGQPEPPPERWGPAYGWPVKLSMIAVSGAYFFVGWHKIEYSGIAWARSGNLRWVLYVASDHQHGNSVGLFVADHPHIAQFFAAMTLVVECFFFLVLFFPITRWFFVPSAVGLHLGIYLTMHLNYTAQIVAVLVTFVNWPVALALSRRWRARGSPSAVPRPA